MVGVQGSDCTVKGCGFKEHDIGSWILWDLDPGFRVHRAKGQRHSFVSTILALPPFYYAVHGLFFRVKNGRVNY